MKTIITLFITITISGIYSCTQKHEFSSGKNLSESVFSSADTLRYAEGERIFSDNCIICHGADGKRQLGDAKDLSVSTLNVEERIKIISSTQLIGNKLHRERWEKVLSENEIRNVAIYIESLKNIKQ